MALPALIGIGLGVMGGAGYLEGKANKKRAEKDYEILENRVMSLGLGESRQGQNLLHDARNQIESAGYFDWANDAPNDYLQDTAGEFGFMYQQQQAEAAQQAAFNQEMRGRGWSRIESLEDDWRADTASYREIQQILPQIIENVSNRSFGPDVFAGLGVLSQMVGQGALTDAEGNRISGGDAGDYISKLANQVMGGGKLGDDAAQRLAETLQSLATGIDGGLGRLTADYQGRLDQWQSNFGQYVPGQYNLSGSGLMASGGWVPPVGGGQKQPAPADGSVGDAAVDATKNLLQRTFEDMESAVDYYLSRGWRED